MVLWIFGEHYSIFHFNRLNQWLPTGWSQSKSRALVHSKWVLSGSTSSKKHQWKCYFETWLISRISLSFWSTILCFQVSSVAATCNFTVQMVYRLQRVTWCLRGYLDSEVRPVTWLQKWQLQSCVQPYKPQATVLDFFKAFTTLTTVVKFVCETDWIFHSVTVTFNTFPLSDHCLALSGKLKATQSSAQPRVSTSQ